MMSVLHSLLEQCNLYNTKCHIFQVFLLTCNSNELRKPGELNTKKKSTKIRKLIVGWCWSISNKANVIVFFVWLRFWVSWISPWFWLVLLGKLSPNNLFDIVWWMFVLWMAEEQWKSRRHWYANILRKCERSLRRSLGTILYFTPSSLLCWHLLSHTSNTCCVCFLSLYVC